METLETVIDRLQLRADNAYVDYIAQSRRDECVGWEIKVERGDFGARELDAHTRRGELLGRHRTLNEAIKLLEELSK